MKKRWMVAVAVVAIALVGVSAFAQDAGEGGRRACSPEGTWFGSNAIGENYIFTITGVGGERYMAVADGLNDPAFCAEASKWRGEMVKTGRNRYEHPADPALRRLRDPAAVGRRGRSGVLRTATTSTSCWTPSGPTSGGPSFTPFVDPFDIPFIPPGEPDAGVLRPDAVAVSG